MSRRFSFSDFGLALFLAAGAQLVILFVGTLVEKPLEHLFSPPSQYPGFLRVHRSGHVVFESPSGGFWSLSGQPLDDADVSRWLRKDDADEGWLSVVLLPHLRLKRVEWSFRLVDLQADARIAWFIVQLQPDDGLGYCIGYDKATKGLFGHIGKKGFRSSVPPREEWFAMPGTLGSQVVQGVFLRRAQTKGMAFLSTEQGIWEVNLTARSARRLFDSSDITCVEATNATKPDLLIRTPSEVMVIDLEGRPRRSWKIPEALRSDDLQWYEFADGGALAETLRRRDGNFDNRLFWLDHDGTITRTEELEEPLRPLIGPKGAYMLMAGATPAPLTWSCASLIAVPLAMVAQREQPDLATAFAHALADAWPALAAVYLFAAVLAWLAYRRQVRYALPAAGLWAVFVFLLGVPGWLAYRWHRDWPLLKECGECRRAAPRDREACAACGQLFAAPPPLGTEIFG